MTGCHIEGETCKWCACVSGKNCGVSGASGSGWLTMLTMSSLHSGDNFIHSVGSHCVVCT